MKKLAVLFTCLLPLPAVAQTCGSQQCTWTLVTFIYILPPGVPAISQGNAFGNYDSLVHCQSAGNAIYSTTVNASWACVPTASVANIH